MLLTVAAVVRRRLVEARARAVRSFAVTRAAGIPSKDSGSPRPSCAGTATRRAWALEKATLFVAFAEGEYSGGNKTSNRNKDFRRPLFAIP